MKFESEVEELSEDQARALLVSFGKEAMIPIGVVYHQTSFMPYAIVAVREDKTMSIGKLYAFPVLLHAANVIEKDLSRDQTV